MTDNGIAQLAQMHISRAMVHGSPHFKILLIAHVLSYAYILHIADSACSRCINIEWYDLSHAD